MHPHNNTSTPLYGFSVPLKIILKNFFSDYLPNQIPVPFQYNLWALDKETAAVCCIGLMDAYASLKGAEGKLSDNCMKPGIDDDFDSWILKYMGVGIANALMRPFNQKQWCMPTGELNVKWVGFRKMFRT